MEQRLTGSPAIAIDVNSERILGSLVDSQGNWNALEMIPFTVPLPADEVIANILVLCQHLRGSQQIAGIGISIAAAVDVRTGVIIHAGGLPLEAQGLALADRISEQTGLPVLVENAANAMAYAEARAGAGIGSESFFYIYAGESIDGALVNQGELWHGRHSSAGQIANLVVDWMGLKPITLTQKASGAAIAAEYNMRSRKFRVPALPDIIQYASQGDQLAIRVLRDGARLLGTVINPVISLLDPQRVIVGGELMRIGDLWWNPFEEALRKGDGSASARVMDIQRAVFQEEAAMIGAGLLVHVPDSTS